MSMTELQDKRGYLVAQARAALDEIQKNTDEARASELEARHDTIMKDFDKLEANIAREERTAALEARVEEARAAKRPVAAGEARGAAEGAKPEYRDAFYKMLSVGGDVAELSSEERSVLRAGVSEVRAQSTTASAGGYTVPTTLANFIVRSMKAWGPMYDEDICTTITTSSGNTITMPTIDDTAVAVAKHTEATQLTDDGGVDATFGQKSLEAYAYDTEWVRISMELLQDSVFNIEALLGDLLGERLGRRVNVELTTGDGTGDPNGIVTASTLGKTAAGAAAITTDELIDLIHSVDPAYRMSPKCRLMFNDATLAVIRKLKNGTGDYLWSAGDIQNGQPGAILGYRYSVNQAMASVATGNKSVIFGDFGKYYVRKVGAPVLGVRREYYWPDMGIAGLVRLDGELADTAAVKHLIQA